ncbi:hypothetical protein Tco_0091748 [Tanacetum coccineum]
MGRIDGRIGDQDGQGGDRSNGANIGVDEVRDFSTVIAQQLQNLLPTIIAQVGNHANNIQGDVRNVSVNNGQGGCSYKEFLACNPKDYDGKGAYTDRFHKLSMLVPHLVTPENKRIERYIYGLAPQIRGMVAETEPMTIKSAILIARVLTDEAIRNGSLKKNIKKRGNGEEPSRDGNVKDDNKRSRTGRGFDVFQKL